MVLLFGLFLLAAVIGVPIAFAFGIASAIYLSWSGLFPVFTIVQRMALAVESWPLLAIPFFMLMGDLFMRGGMGARLLNLVSAAVGRMPGALGVVCVVVNMIMAGVSGAALADAVAIGAVLIPEMRRKGYPKEFIVALHSTSAVIGIIIPPSIPMIIYAWLTNTSVRSLFLGGVIPGILVGIALAIPTVLIAWREGYPREEWPGWREFGRQFAPNVWAFLAPVIVLGGILSGIVTTTESAVIGCAYVLAVELLIYRQLSARQIGQIFANAAKMTSAALLILATASGYGIILTALRVPQIVAEWIMGIFGTPWMIFLAINIWFLIQGCFLDLLPGLFLATPIFYPIAVQAGMDPIQFGVMLTINLGIGLFTPPVGTVLYAVCVLGEAKMEAVIPRLFPFFVGMVLVLMLVTYWPPLTLWMGRR